MNKTKIVVIHDDIKENDPLIIELYLKYGKDSVILKEKSKDGLDYVLSHLSQKMIVILDLNFKSGEANGVAVFEDIRKKTSLVYILIWTASMLENIDREDLKKMINNDALGLLSNTDDIENILSMVDFAAHQLEVRVASALEDWITSQPEKDRNAPYITSREGKTYSLNQILEEIRLQTPFGMETEKSILLLAIDLLDQNHSEDGKV
jgi:hypothetical protein